MSGLLFWAKSKQSGSRVATLDAKISVDSDNSSTSCFNLVKIDRIRQKKFLGRDKSSF